MTGSGGMERLEKLRAFVEGSLPEAERRAFAAEVERDHELAELVDAYRAVVDATEDEGAPASTTAFSDLHLRGPSLRRVAAVVAAAAVIVVAIGIAVWGGAGAEPAGPDTVTLASVVLSRAESAPATPVLPEPPPELAETYLPGNGRVAGSDNPDDKTIAWLDDLAEALAIGRYSGRPVLLFVDYAGCPLCVRYERDVFPDEGVRKAASRFVMLRLSWDEAPPEIQKDYKLGWPLFPVLDASGKKIDGFVGYKSARPFARWLTAAGNRLTRAGSSGAGSSGAGPFRPRPWDEVHALAKRARAAQTFDDFAALAAADKGGPFGDFARARIDAWHAAAARALRAAREAAEQDGSSAGAAKARTLLEDAHRALDGTPFGTDLKAVLDSLGDRGAFPRLVTAKTE